MKIKRKKFVIIISLIIGIGIIALLLIKKNNKTPVISRILTAQYGDIMTVVSATGTVLPYNRLEVTPQISGRMEKILVREGQYVRKGQILGWMSSTERAALIDAARAQDPASLKYWEKVYKPIPIVAPINGTVIVRDIEPGQAVLTTTAMLVLSDRLIVKANVDETDIGRVKVNQQVIISLDAYPDVKITGHVDLIEYESEVVNNVTMYVVNIVPEKVPEMFRSGMSSNVDIIEKSKKQVLLLPIEAVATENNKQYVWIKKGRDSKPVKRIITTGISDEQNIEILSGISDKDKIAVMSLTNIPLEVKENGSPFMPSRKKPR